MSKATFAIGAILVLVGVGLAAYVVFFAEGTEEQATLGALGAFFGGSGIVTTLLTVFKATTKELRTITSDMAKIHMILTGFGAETTNLRKIELENTPAEVSAQLRDITKQNQEFRNITQHAVNLLPSDQPPAEDEKRKEKEEPDAAPSLKRRVLRVVLRR